MLKVDIKLRPTSKQILKYPIVKEMEEVYLDGIDYKGPMYIDVKAIEKPIYIPKNLSKLNTRLPKPKYDIDFSYKNLSDKQILPQIEEKKAYHIVPSHLRRVKKNISEVIIKRQLINNSKSQNKNL